jgi:lipopolysaccharide/colanic/teichoic acid biosynthesis glycosyltransferase
VAREYASPEEVPGDLDGVSRSVPRTERGVRLRLYAASKRLIDVALSTLLLIVLALPMVLIAVAVRLTSPGPAVFRQVRLGRDGRPFVMLKFRSMHQDADDQVHRSYVSAMLEGEVESSGDPQAIYKLTQDDRVTRLGAFLRKTSLDELPQLIDVFVGHMTLVGPRPALPWEAELFGPQYRTRFEVKPGMTGLWQVSGRSNLTMSQALELDERYVQDRSLALDLMILLRTVPVVLFGRGAS